MDLQYVKGSYMAEIMFEDRPVLFTLEGLDEGRDSEALRYSMMIWDWVKLYSQSLILQAIWLKVTLP